jgi:hypothetical protein
MRRALCARELSNPMLPRKVPAELTPLVIVPQTDSGGREEYSKALERSLSKELGKITPYFGRRCARFRDELAL